MTQEQFVPDVLELLFVQGFNCSDLSLLLWCAQEERQHHGDWPDVATFAERCVQSNGVTYQRRRMGKLPSPTAGACDRWLAVHEAGHAIVGIESGLACWGVRFYGDDGHPGETGFEPFEWECSTNETLLRRHIRIDVAANLAEVLLNVREPDGGIPSRFFDHRDPADECPCPSDIQDAWKCARQLAVVQCVRAGRPLVADQMWKARRDIIEQAEAEAEQALRGNLPALDRVAGLLMRGPMTGAQVRAIVAR